MKERLPYEQSGKYLQQEGLLREGDIPPMLPRPPRYDDETLGIDFLRWGIHDSNLESLTLPRTYICRSSFERCSLAHSDLSESVINWNDFEDVSFESTNLSKADLRACSYKRVSFKNATLFQADLRCTELQNCDFANADLREVKLTRENGNRLMLSLKQQQEITWQDEDGDDPAGG